MSDNSSKILSALFMLGEKDRQTQNVDYAHTKQNNALQAENNELQGSYNRLNDTSIEMEGEIAVLIRQKHHLLEEFAKERNYRNKVVRLYNALLDKHADLEKSHAQLMASLSKPMEEIVQAQPAFKAAYDQQMMLLGKWMISQKAFKAVAIELGLEKGMTIEEVFAAGNTKKIDVLNNAFPNTYGSNGTDIGLLENRVDEFKAQLEAELAEKK